ncbi:MAG TPA: DUF3168 domain-containing protein [Phycisphaerae bacterium]|nr:DUF3168 domain-containing protein [Phycisphaerae bacterium]
MAVEVDMRTALTTDVTVAGLVGTRIFPGIAPQDAALPHIIYQRIAGGPLQASGGPMSTINANYVFICRDKTYAGVKTLAAAVRAVLDGWDNTSGTPAVSSCRLEDEGEDTEYRSDDSEDLVHVVTQEYSLWYA